MSGAAGMAELAQRLGLDLTDTLTGDIVLRAHLFQGAGVSVIKAETKLDHVRLTGRQGSGLTFQ